ncbi:hypothetical protein DFA_10883 [Cavenderia fasciculata]|uniref:Uncharacterized protein n=1 Tax=Cavenderia fasciculata TaxID=261658 RepID=F4QBN7_CACFS|nr:uncharacterized protein DFA_10883 [Cavenderia fasciculata]EGG14625.1 hypothetical protein DFA_10883 [Cavenderia fasciculata]|eukprot:XP_004351133.1 hypothetical protein DFA_10883 [Cavenderia fasciculata]
MKKVEDIIKDLKRRCFSQDKAKGVKVDGQNVITIDGQDDNKDNKDTQMKPLLDDEPMDEQVGVDAQMEPLSGGQDDDDDGDDDHHAFTDFQDEEKLKNLTDKDLSIALDSIPLFVEIALNVAFYDKIDDYILKIFKDIGYPGFVVSDDAKQRRKNKNFVKDKTVIFFGDAVFRL